MALLMEYKWWILLTSESIAWLATLYMAYARYLLLSKVQFYISGSIAIITGYFPHITLGIIDYFKQGELKPFSLVIIILIILGVTIFKKYLIQIDNSIKMWAEEKYIVRKGKG